MSAPTHRWVYWSEADNTPMPQDRELLQQFVREKSQPAFRQLVQRHSRWLYSVCLRRLRDPAMAEDATQAVFLALAQRAPALVNEKTISPWLHQAARFCASKMLRARTRRQRHESEAAMMKSAHLASPHTSDWRDIEADLEPALDRLGPRDRATILLRFYEQKSHAETAALLGISLEASQKRLSRALQRLRAALLRNGKGDVSLSVLAIGELLAKHGAGTAPASLLTSTATTYAGPIAKQILFSMRLAAALKTVAIAAVVLLLAIPSGLLLLRAGAATPALAQTAPAPAAVLASPAPVASPATQPATAPAITNSVYKIANTVFTARSRANEYLIGIDPDTKRTADAEPAGYAKSLLPRFLPNDQNPALRFYKAPYNDLRGKRVRLSAWMKTRNVEEWGGLQIIVFGKDGKILLSDDMSSRPVHGTTDWTEHELVVDVPSDATAIAVLSVLYGKGELWSDDFQLRPVGPEVAVTNNQPWRAFSFFAANYTAVPDPQVLHDGHAAICIASTSEATNKQWISYNHDEPNLEKFRGARIRVTVWMRSSGVSGGSGAWIKCALPSGTYADEGQRGHRPLHGTTDWKQYTAVADVPADAITLGWGIVMNGTGKLWVDVDSAKCVIDDTSGL